LWTTARFVYYCHAAELFVISALAPFVRLGFTSPMPPAKGDLSALMAILSLLVGGPESRSGIRSRLRREFPSGNWSRSIVDSSLPSLLEKGSVVLVGSGEEPSEEIYEASARGVDEFREWMRGSARAPLPLRDSFLLWIEHSTEAELPSLIQAAREMEEAAKAEFDEARRRLNSERVLGNLGPPDGSDWTGRMRYAVLSETVVIWHQRAARLKSLRLRLSQGYSKHAEIPVDDDE
jgi:DNA-binding PadR family transcriptional regulator